METGLENLLQNGLQKGIPFALSFLDDVLLIVLSNFGINLPWLEWLCPILLVCMCMYWTMQLIRTRYAR